MHIGSNSAIITDVASLLESGEVTAAHGGKGKDIIAEDENEDPAVSQTAVVTHLYPADCPNLPSAMKSVITSFVDHQAEEKEEGKQRINRECASVGRRFGSHSTQYPTRQNANRRLLWQTLTLTYSGFGTRPYPTSTVCDSSRQVDCF